MRKFAALLSAFAMVFTLSACGKTEVSSESGTVSDPFGESGSMSTAEDNSNSVSESVNSSDNNIDALWDRANNTITEMLSGGYLADYGSEPLVYNGDPVKTTLTITTDEENSVDRSVGVMAFIDDIPQEVSLDGEKFGHMAVYTGLEPGKPHTGELFIMPSVSAEEGETLKVTFADCDTPDYRAVEQCMAYWGVHSFSQFRGSLDLVMNVRVKAPKEHIAQTEVRGEVNTQKKGTPNIVKKNFDKTSGYCLNEDGTLSGTYVLYCGKETRHRIMFFVNDRPVTFNGGKAYCDIEYTDGYMYTFDFTLDEKPEQMDIFYALDLYATQEDHGANPCVTDEGPYVVVRYDFVDEHYLKYKGR